MIEGAVRDLGREPQNIQVVLSEEESGTTVSLHDESGAFLTAVPPEERPPSSSPEPLTESQEGEETLLAEIQSLCLALQTTKEEVLASQSNVSTLTTQLEGEKKRTKDLWRLNCSQLTEFDSTLAQKDDEIEALQRALAGSSSCAATPAEGGAATQASAHTVRTPVSVVRRRGKAPPVDAFTGEDPEVRFEDWLPSLKRAAEWNAWEPEELLLQLAGHLRGRALQEYNLLDSIAASTFSDVVKMLQSRLDPGGKALAAQDFRHASQRKGENVSNFIRRLERTFQVAYGRDGMLPQTRDALLYSQLQEGLCHSLMEAPAVSGATSYSSLCLAAKNEERRLAALRSRKGYQGMPPSVTTTWNKTEVMRPTGSLPRTHNGGPSPRSDAESNARKCYLCGKAGHIARECRSTKKTESKGRSSVDHQPLSGGTQARLVQASSSVGDPRPTPLALLYSSTDEEDDSDPQLYQVRVTDKGSHAHCARVEVQGVPMYGIVDSGADITIIGGALFKRVATIARLRKRDFKPPDKTPKTYDQRSFKLDGRMDLDISFGDQTMCTPVYIKMDAHDQLLLSEGVCRQLGIVTYHPDVETWRGCRKRAPKHRSDGASEDARRQSDLQTEAQQPWVPTVRVKLVQAVKLDPRRSTVVKARLVPDCVGETPVLVEGDPDLEKRTGLVFDDALVQPAKDGSVELLLTNATAFPQVADSDADLGEATLVTPVEPGTLRGDEVEGPGDASLTAEKLEATLREVSTARDSSGHPGPVTVRRVTTPGSVQERQQRLLQLLPKIQTLKPSQTDRLHNLITSNHGTFSLDKHERGETDLLQFKVDTGDARPKKLPARRMPLAVRDEVAHQLREMQEAGVVQPSRSPWSSPVVMVRKKDGSHRFCVDYRHLNSVTKSDNFPLPGLVEYYTLWKLFPVYYRGPKSVGTLFCSLYIYRESKSVSVVVTPVYI